MCFLNILTANTVEFYMYLLKAATTDCFPEVCYNFSEIGNIQL